MQALIALAQSIVLSIYAWLLMVAFIVAVAGGGLAWLVFGGLLCGAILYNCLSDQA
ncbi:hypothetical protein IQ266_26910 [filamentous cyanobacterium LEGE 11480]|uniref:Uncharacterized protein n=1 Tax=Romeriopsis navalis LEGE 11480 TaxID=2777977 RepID=A0A928VVJ4_9CYAN|nr:hypothetical protein [Romeriopsis navalis]MBE9033370.1 hypothetical protein [Romeriopsis navalis LEGE 11480]